MGDDDGVGTHRVQPAQLAPRQSGHHLVLDVGDVADASPQVLVFDVAEHLLEPFHRLRKGVLGADPIRTDRRHRPAFDLIVLQHRQLRLEYLRQFGAVLQLDDSACPANLFRHMDETIEEALRLCLDFEARDAAPGDPRSLDSMYERTADADAGADGYADEFFHGSGLRLEVALQQRCHRLDGFALVVALGLDQQFGSVLCRQHHDAHDTLAVDTPDFSLGEKDLGLELRRRLHQHGGRTGVNAQAILDDYPLFNH